MNLIPANQYKSHGSDLYLPEYFKIVKVNGTTIKVNDGLIYHIPSTFANLSSNSNIGESDDDFTIETEITGAYIEDSFSYYRDGEKINGAEYTISQNSSVFVKIPFSASSGGLTLLAACDSLGGIIPGWDAKPVFQSLLPIKSYAFVNTISNTQIEVLPSNQENVEFNEDIVTPGGSVINTTGFIRIKIADVLTADSEIDEIRQYHFGPIEISDSSAYYGNYHDGEDL